jgi:hypothetical protein
MTSKTFYRYLPLVALMAVTRIHHFGNAFFLPDASLAVFFLAGLFFNSRAFFVALLLEAGLLDYVAISQFNVNDFCVSPAYVFLIPTYFALWFGGRLSANSNVSAAMLTLLTSVSGAYLISNSSFYLLSDNISQRDFSKYVEQLSHYYAPYAGYALMYAVLGFASVKAVKMLPDLLARKTV